MWAYWHDDADKCILATFCRKSSNKGTNRWISVSAKEATNTFRVLYASHSLLLMAFHYYSEKQLPYRIISPTPNPSPAQHE
jgi:hypothetical protein